MKAPETVLGLGTARTGVQQPRVRERLLDAKRGPWGNQPSVGAAMRSRERGQKKQAF